jgi:hypothetical protein
MRDDARSAEIADFLGWDERLPELLAMTKEVELHTSWLRPRGGLDLTDPDGERALDALLNLRPRCDLSLKIGVLGGHDGDENPERDADLAALVEARGCPVVELELEGVVSKRRKDETLDPAERARRGLSAALAIQERFGRLVPVVLGSTPLRTSDGGAESAETLLRLRDALVLGGVTTRGVSVAVNLDKQDDKLTQAVIMADAVRRGGLRFGWTPVCTATDTKNYTATIVDAARQLSASSDDVARVKCASWSGDPDNNRDRTALVPDLSTHVAIALEMARAV